MTDTKTLFAIGLLGTGALALGAAAFGQTRQFDDFDKNGDHRITLGEWQGGAADLGIVADHDRNDDSRLDSNKRSRSS